MKTFIFFKKMNQNAIVPKYGTDDAACADLYACFDNKEDKVAIMPGETKLIKTGIAMEIPTTLAGCIFARSGLATKQGLAPANKVGIIDPDYRGEIMVALHNHGTETQVVEKGERVAQIVIAPYVTATFVDGDLDETERGAGGFGSTGTK